MSALDAELHYYEQGILSNDIVTMNFPKTETDLLSLLPISGNGFVLVSLLNGELYIRHRRTLSVSTNQGVLFRADITPVRSAEELVMSHVADGYVQHLKTYSNVGFLS